MVYNDVSVMYRAETRRHESQGQAPHPTGSTERALLRPHVAGRLAAVVSFCLLLAACGAPTNSGRTAGTEAPTTVAPGSERTAQATAPAAQAPDADPTRSPGSATRAPSNATVATAGVTPGGGATDRPAQSGAGAARPTPPSAGATTRPATVTPERPVRRETTATPRPAATASSAVATASGSHSRGAAREFGLERPVDAQPARVARVIDGDTLEVSLNGRTERVRLLGVDTPETVHPEKAVQCFGREASAKTEHLLSKRDIFLAADPLAANRDHYDRLLRYVWLPDGTLVNLELIAQGYAHELTVDPYAYQEAFRPAEERARDAGRGLWASDTCAGDTDRPADSVPAGSDPRAEADINRRVPPPPAQPSSGDRAGCDPSYPDVCIPPPPPDLDCPEIPHRRFTVQPPDRHRFDGDRDGIGCES